MSTPILIWRHNLTSLRPSPHAIYDQPEVYFSVLRQQKCGEKNPSNFIFGFPYHDLIWRLVRSKYI